MAVSWWPWQEEKTRRLLVLIMSGLESRKIFEEKRALFGEK
jgi:hypothetical protein